MRLSAKLIVVVTGVVAVMILTIFTLLSLRYHKQIHESLLQTARAFYSEIVVTRSWIALHSGVYVPKDEAIDPDTYYEGSEFVGPDGNEYILKTPAQVTRELSELSEAMGARFRFHITSLDPVNPRNAPTDFERKALLRFRELTTSGSYQGPLEATTVEEIDGEKYFRYFGPLIASSYCLRCHNDPGLQEGGIRGGISVLLPMSEVEQAMARNRLFMAGSAVVAVLVISFILFYSIRYVVLRPLSKVEQATKKIERGDYKTDLPVNSHDEIGDLARAFHRMQETIRNYTNSLRQSQQKYRALLQRSPEAIVIVDNRDVIREANENITRLSQYRVDELRGKPLSFLLDPKLKREYGFYSGSEPTGERYESSLRRKDGTLVPVEVYVSLDEEAEPDGPPPRFLYIHDITDRKKIEAHLVESEKMYALGQLSSGIAHEIRNPLFGIRNNLEYLRKRFSEDGELHEIYDEMMQSIERMNKLVNDVLDFSRPHKPELHLCSLEEIIQRSVDLVRKEFDRANARIEIEIREPLPRLNLDPHRMEQVFINLLTNSLQAFQNGRGLVRVVCRRRRDRQVEVSFEDNGVGIEPEDLGRIFDPFFTKCPQGTGLGLTIVRSIVQQHGGTIKVRSTPGKGTVFVLTFPIPKPEDVSDEVPTARGG